MRSLKSIRAFRLGGLGALVLLSSCVTVGRADAQPEVGVSVEVFDRALAPYGEWVGVGRFGHAWRPYQTVVGLGFRPYLTAGHWVYTDYGWSFESDYDWGWAPFHYGRWFLDDYYGWVWVPDTVWGPAWVDWRFGGGYVGWVPLAPVGVSISYGFYRPAWCFVPVTHFVVRDVYHYALPVERFHWAYSATSPVQQPIHYAGAQWNAGPPPGQVSQATGQPIHAAGIAPPPPGRIQPVHITPAGGTATQVAGVPANTPGGSPSYAPHPPSGMVPSSAPPANPAPAPSPDARWGNTPVGGSAHWRGPDSSTSAPPGHAAPVSPAPMPSSPHPWMASPGASSSAPHPPSEAHWGQTPVNVAPRGSGENAPSGRPSYGGAVSPAAPMPAPSGHSFSPAPSVSPAPRVAPVPAPSASPAPRIAPVPAPSVRPSAPAPHPAAPPSGKQGFYSPRFYSPPANAGAPQIRSLYAGSFGRSSSGFGHVSAPIASRSAPSAFGFGHRR